MNKDKYTNKSMNERKEKTLKGDPKRKNDCFLFFCNLQKQDKNKTIHRQQECEPAYDLVKKAANLILECNSLPS